MSSKRLWQFVRQGFLQVYLDFNLLSFLCLQSGEYLIFWHWVYEAWPREGLGLFTRRCCSRVRDSVDKQEQVFPTAATLKNITKEWMISLTFSDCSTVSRRYYQTDFPVLYSYCIIVEAARYNFSRMNLLLLKKHLIFFVIVMRQFKATASLLIFLVPQYKLAAALVFNGELHPAVCRTTVVPQNAECSQVSVLFFGVSCQIKMLHLWYRGCDRSAAVSGEGRVMMSPALLMTVSTCDPFNKSVHIKPRDVLVLCGGTCVWSCALQDILVCLHSWLSSW